MNRVDMMSQTVGETNDCVVRAIAHACQLPYTESHELCAKQGRQPRKGVPFISKVLPVLRERFTITDVTKHYNARTIRTLQREIGKGRFIVQVRAHVLAIMDGEVMDWANNRCHRILYIFKIED